MTSPAVLQPQAVAADGDDYVLGSSDAERIRLLRQARTHAAAAARLLDEIGVADGWRAIDIGCGPVGILPELAARIGVTGSVLGLDNEPRMLQMAARTLEELELANVGLHQAPAHASGLPRASFDLTHARLLLVNVPRPHEVLSEMVALTCSGGVVALQDIDWISWTCEPPHPAWERLRDAVDAMRCDSGLDVRIGRRLPALLKHAGLVDVQVRADAAVWRRGDPAHTLLLHFAQLHRERLVDGGWLDADTLQRSIDELRAHLERDDTLSIDALMFQAWGRRP